MFAFMQDGNHATSNVTLVGKVGNEEVFYYFVLKRIHFFKQEPLVRSNFCSILLDMTLK